MANDQISEDRAVEILEVLGLQGARLRRDISIPGSPERCVARAVAEDQAGILWVLERLFPGQAERRDPIAKTMALLSAKGLRTVPAFRPCRAGGYSLRHGGWDWQVGPYVAGDRLPQPGYVHDAQRGRSLGLFLGGLHRLGPDVCCGLNASFSLSGYMDGLLTIIAERRPGLLVALRPIRGSLQELDEAWDELPRSLAHGDFHPLNVIWRGQEVRSVIDWEFCGLRPELYDAANLLGCTGSEDPKALGCGLARAFLDELRHNGVLTPANGRWLFPLFLGLRFAWLSEWLRRGDESMLEMEMAYMRLALASRSELERVWLGAAS